MTGAARLLTPLIASLTLGLAPFQPEPHVVEKLRRVATAPGGMAPIDWFDLVLHGAPWVWLAVAAVGVLRERSGAAGGADGEPPVNPPAGRRS